MSEPMKLDVKMSDETRIALLEQAINHINDALINIDKKIDSIKDITIRKLDFMESRIAKIDEKIDFHAKEVNENYKSFNEIT